MSDPSLKPSNPLSIDGETTDTPSASQGWSKASRYLVFWLGPVLFVLLAFCLPPFDASRGNVLNAAAGITVWMALWWLTEVVPLAVTALLPVVLFPLFGVLPGGQVSQQYMNAIMFLFMGGFVLAISLEKWGLHRRFALYLISHAGLHPARVMLGFMVATAGLSMWISNTAATLMMLPMALAVIDQLRTVLAPGVYKRFETSLLLSIAYAASVGGMATLLGTPPNMIFVQIYQMEFPEAMPMGFGKWLLFGLPIAMTLLAAFWAVLSAPLWHLPKQLFEQTRATLRSDLAAMGPMSGPQKRLMVIFVLTALLWITRSDLSLGVVHLSGWGNWFTMWDAAGQRQVPMINDGTIAMAAALLLFVLPSGGRCAAGGEETALMQWQDMKRFPWNIFLLLGGGFALAEGLTASGLSAWVAHLVVEHSPLTAKGLIVSVCLMINFLTELASNTASTQMLMPVLATISRQLHIDPLLLMIPATLCASCAFMMPVATAPNAIVFGTNRLRIKDMARYGLLFNFISVGIIVGLTFLIEALI
ncbi:MAG: SLC13 family permease [Vampirovibrionales bacterium]|nr:SLC13/DASS family transporter [Cyanobacteria bacterium HKST-UBA03]